MSVVGERLLTADEYLRSPDNGEKSELVRGKVVKVNVPTPRHGQICSRIYYFVGVYAFDHNHGHVVMNDSGVVTEHDPDSVRGPEVSYYSYRQIPPGRLPAGYLKATPEIVFEVRSTSDRWSVILAKVSEYLDAGVKVVCVLDQISETLQVFRPDDLPMKLQGEDDFTLPDLFGDFRMKVRQFFD
jgi:Uma2 family endonuclease